MYNIYHKIRLFCDRNKRGYLYSICVVINFIYSWPHQGMMLAFHVRMQELKN